MFAIMADSKRYLNFIAHLQTAITFFGEEDYGFAVGFAKFLGGDVFGVPEIVKKSFRILMEINEKPEDIPFANLVSTCVFDSILAADGLEP